LPESLQHGSKKGENRGNRRGEQEQGAKTKFISFPFGTTAAVLEMEAKRIVAESTRTDTRPFLRDAKYIRKQDHLIDMPPKVGMPNDGRFKYPTVLTQKGNPDKRYNCNAVVGGKRPPQLPQDQSSDENTKEATSS